MGFFCDGATELQKDLIVGVTTARVINTLGFGTNNYYKIDNEFLEVTGTAEDSQGLTTLILAEEKGTPCFDGQQIKVRYLYSQARFTGHDFLKIGTGGTVTSNWPAEPTQDPFLLMKLLRIFQVACSTFLPIRKATSVLVSTSALTRQLVLQP